MTKKLAPLLALLPFFIGQAVAQEAKPMLMLRVEKYISPKG